MSEVLGEAMKGKADDALFGSGASTGHSAEARRLAGVFGNWEAMNVLTLNLKVSIARV